MKRRLIAMAAVGAMAGTAHAQTSVTLYGVVDLGVEYVNRVATAPSAPGLGTLGTAPVGSRFGLPNQGGLSASRWGLRGREDLGGGAYAFFTLESQFNTDTGTFTGGSGLFNRQALLGLGNAYGKLSFGKQYSSFMESMVNFSPTRFAPAYEPGIWWVGLDYKPNNTIKYAGNFGPLTALAHYSFGAGLPVSSFGAGGLLYGGGAGETPGAPRDDTAWGGALTYLGQNFGGSIAYDQWNPAATVGNTGKVRKAGVAGSYTNGPLKLMAGYRWGDQTFVNGNTALRDDYWFAGVNYRFTPALDMQLGYFYSNVKKFASTNSSVATNPANPQQVSFVADYALSKRTDVYLSAGWAHNGSLGNDGPFTLFLFNYPQAPGQKNMVGVTTGVRHVF
ncbi:Outer membrane porin protein 32 [Cupriavidus laharis]|uniref:Outer membrane porin protein 32 n=1 Tax=Cupriavidus laharis TaxID=151654 RepID=A0ABN7YE18_9BURK|nr:porin [Cupriavidus laharis]CAG9171168.1 Outer membrane porin protein 32 [Cupriavidus laharis]